MIIVMTARRSSSSGIGRATVQQQIKKYMVQQSPKVAAVKAVAALAQT